jgi:2-keto-3-deoxy-L-rhamnonate aldolase RhmA
VPQVKSAHEAEKAVTAANYPPRGTRSVGLARAHAYGMDFANYVQRANDSVAILLQIEHIESVNNLEAILKVEGVDGIIIGPYDLSGSLDKLGKVQDKDVIEAIDHIRQLCQKANLPCGIFTLQTEAAQAYLKQGFRLVALGIDTYYLWYSARASLNTVKSQLVEERSSARRS